MKKEDAITCISSVETMILQLQNQIQKAKIKFINRKEIQASAKKAAVKWFEDIDPFLDKFKVPDEIKQKYRHLFTELILIATKGSPSTSYLNNLKRITENYKSDILIPIMKSPGRIISVDTLSKILENATEEEKEYLNEAIGCAENGYFRGSIVLAWCATVNRMHRVIEKLGFDEFNKKSNEMKILQEGRFKRFSKSFKVNSISEIRSTVFDNDLLWVLEYWQLIDANQHDRLSTCFIMRNNSGHPGEALITPENLISFYSDLKQIIFDNPKLKL